MNVLRVVNPATEEVIAELPIASKEDVERAIDESYEAFLKWSETPLRDRIRLLRKVADLMEAHAEELVKSLVLESGKPIKDAWIEVKRAIDIVRISAEEARLVLEGRAPRIDGFEYPAGNERRIVIEIREPIGVVGAAQSYNNPVVTFAHKVAPVVVAGNTVIVKPSSYTPLTALKMWELFKKAGFPQGVVNVVIGPGEEVFNILIESPKVAAISFTGSTAVGLQVAAKAAGRGKKFMIAPGGSDPAIVFEDADVELAVRLIVRGRFEYAGQNCNATKRVYVHKSIYEEFVRRLVEHTSRIKVGDPMDPEVDMGPLISDRLVRQMEKFVADAIEKGGRVLIGGRRMPRRGYFFEPTVIEFKDGHSDALVFTEEVFGPVLPIAPFETEEEAVELANWNKYGLQAAIFTRDYKRAFRIARQIKAGSIMINDTTRVRFDALPYGGVKMSGLGWREGIRSTMYYYTEPKFYVLSLE